MKRLMLIAVLFCVSLKSFSWGFYAHQRINYFAVFLLPPQMLVLFKPEIQFLSDHAVDADKRRYVVAAEAPKHYIDLDNYGPYPYDQLPRKWSDAVNRFSEDSLLQNGIVPWHIFNVQYQLTEAFKEKNKVKILKLAADLGHYVSDAHVPLHASKNHDGQLGNQKGIHAFWEGRIPELLAEREFDFMLGKAQYVPNVQEFVWKRVLESGTAADTVLTAEAELTKQFKSRAKYAFEERNGKLVRQYSSGFTLAYNKKLDNMVERRMRQSIVAVANLWYTAWINAGQPDLKELSNTVFTAADSREFEDLNTAWKSGTLEGREHE